MAESADKDSKTEEATEKKIRDAVEKGQLPHSREAAILASFVAILVFTVFFARDSVVELSGFLSSFLEKPDAWPLDTRVRRRSTSAHRASCEIGKALAAMLLLLMVAGVGASVFQHAPHFVVDRIRRSCRASRSAKGWKRLFGVQGFVEFAEIARQARLRLGVPDVCRQRGAAPAAARHDHPARRLRPGDPRDRHQHPLGARPSPW